MLSATTKKDSTLQRVYSPASGLSVSGVRPGSVGTKGRSKYRRVSKESVVDETLFGSPLPSEGWENNVEKKPKSRPLLWSPPSYGSPTATDRSRPNTPVTPGGTKNPYRTRNKYRPLKWSPSYVDETLFGPKLDPPSFEAPWVKTEDKKPRPLTWCPPDYSSGAVRRPASGISTRPLSRQGAGRPPSATSSSARGNSTAGLYTPTSSKPAWR